MRPPWGLSRVYTVWTVTTKRDRVLNVRLTGRQRAAYERAAALENTTLSAFVTEAADERAERVLVARSSMQVPSDVFDGLLALLDEPGERLPWMEKVLADQRFTHV